MLKKLITLSLIYAVLLVSTYSLNAQDQTVPAVKAEPATPKTDVQKAFPKELPKPATEVSSIDFKKLEKIEMRNAAKAKMSKRDKVLIVVLIVAAVVGAIVLWKFIHVPKCSQVSCDPDFDENCICDNGT